MISRTIGGLVLAAMVASGCGSFRQWDGGGNDVADTGTPPDRPDARMDAVDAVDVAPDTTPEDTTVDVPGDTGPGPCTAATECAMRTHATAACTEGTCVYACDMGWGDCDGMPANGCETDTTTSTMHCGACGMACSTTNGTASCMAGRCGITCATGYGDCDGMVATGCETNTSTATRNCGACMRDCTALPHVTGLGVTCTAGTCTVPPTACEAGWAHCSMRAEDGCETDLSQSAHCGACSTVCAGGTPVCTRTGSMPLSFRCTSGCTDPTPTLCMGSCVDTTTSPSNCGGCGVACPAVIHGAATCAGGACDFRCVTGYHACSSACVESASVATCGTACTPCVPPTNATATCDGTTCGFACAAGWGNCDGMPGNGCETPTSTTLAHCGGCGMACAARAHSTAACMGGACRYTCDTGWADCNGVASDGCEASLGAAANCGRCGNACPTSSPLCSPSGTTWSCVTGCPTGQNLCGGVCSDPLTDVNNCRGCGMVCPVPPHGLPTCTSAGCGVRCTLSTGWQDCNGSASDGCETDVTSSAAHCSGCGRPCPAGANGTPACTGSRCGYTCASGWGDCTLVAGCETNLQVDVGNCGRCGVACPAGDNGTPRCTTGTCGYACNAGWGDCNPSLGCETDLNTNPYSCGSCGHVCPAGANGSPTCMAGTCRFTCNPGWGDCNSNPADGCETNLIFNGHCGACGVTCSGGTICSAGTCATACPAGQSICSGNCADFWSNVRYCGSCSTACGAVTNGTAACLGGACAPVCNPGFDDCDGVYTNGCETALNTPSNCGACGATCATGSTCDTTGSCLRVNDLRTNATAISLATGETVLRGSTLGATPDLLAGCPGTGPNVWYRFTLGVREVVYVDTAGSYFDTVLGIADSAGTPVAGMCNDDAGCTTGGFTNGLQTMIAGVLEPGTYYLAAGSYGGGGNFRVRIQHLPTTAAADFVLPSIIGASTAAGILAGTSRQATTCPVSGAGGVSAEDARWFVTCGGRQQMFSLCPAQGGTFTRGSGTMLYTPVLYLFTGLYGAQGYCNATGSCAGTGGDGAIVGESYTPALPRGLHAIFVDERTAGSTSTSGMNYTLAYNIAR